MKKAKSPDISSQWQVERPDIEPSVSRLIGLIYRLSQQAEAEFRILAQESFDLGTGDLRILLALRRAGPMRPTDLFQSLLISSGAVTKQIYRLEERGFVERQQDPAHRGGSLLTLTAQGRRTANQAIETIVRSSRLSQAFLGLPGGEAAKGLNFLQALFDAVEATDH
jgi:DNA-binding MarR family transcriptional regulator